MVISSFTTHQIRGKGRGKFLGFPTINMQIPAGFILAEGIYAVWVAIGEKKCMGAMHFGPIPVFDEQAKSLEVFLLDINEKDFDTLDTSVIHVTPVKRLREVRAFGSTGDMVIQIRQDVVDTKRILTD